MESIEFTLCLCTEGGNAQKICTQLCHSQSHFCRPACRDVEETCGVGVDGEEKKSELEGRRDTVSGGRKGETEREERERGVANE